MKQTTFLWILFFVTTDLYGQKFSIEQIDNDLSQSYQKIVSNRLNSDSIDWNKLENDNRVFSEKMLYYTSNYPETLTFKFDSLRKDNIHIVSSDDQLFRIYSWDTWLGGSMRNFKNIFQYKSGNKVYCNANIDTAFSEGNDGGPFYSEIFTLKANNKTYYLAVNNGILSSKDVSQSIKAFVIENNALNDTLKLFKTKTKLLNEIEVYFDFFSVVNRPERPLRLIKYDPNKKIISIPVVLENGKVTDRYILYQFKGKYFEHILTQH